MLTIFRGLSSIFNDYDLFHPIPTNQTDLPKNPVIDLTPTEKFTPQENSWLQILKEFLNDIRRMFQHRGCPA
jgi:hypothetical protein